MRRFPERPGATVWQALWGSRVFAWLAALIGVLQIGVARGAVAAYDPTHLSAPFGNYLANAAVAPLARFDSVWYLNIAQSGYGVDHRRMAFFPLYPALIHAGAWIVRSDLIAGVLISLIAFAVALELLRRLVLLDFDQRVANATVMLVAFAPMAFFFSAVYTESLFLALSVGAIYAARRERWWLAGLLGGLAALSRNAGVVLILPMAVIYLYGTRTPGEPPTQPTRVGSGFAALRPTRRLRANVAWLALVPAGLGVYLGYLALKYGQGLAPFHQEAAWYRHTTSPLTTVWLGAEQAWGGLRQLAQGPAPPYHIPLYAAGAIGSATEDIVLFAFLLAGIIALIGTIRQLPFAYWLYALALMLIALSDPVKFQPLASLPRYELVIFPLFIWAARALTRWRVLMPALAASALLLGLFSIEFATFRWVA